MIAPQTQLKLNDVAERFGKELFQQIRNILSKYSRTGELVESVTLAIVKATDKESPKIIVSYADQGYFIGHRSPQWTRLPNVGKLESWGQEITFSGPIPGYKSGMAPNLPPWKIKQRILWAIAKSKQKFDTHRPKRWKKEAKIGDLIKALNVETVAAFSAEIEQILTDALEGRS